MTTKKTILVIDDEVELVNMLKKHLETRGYKVITAYNGSQALETLKENKPDLILLDLVMPEMSGIDFYNKICSKENKPDYPVLVLTGRSNMEEMFREFNVDGFLAKPFKYEKLIDEIQKIFYRIDQPVKWSKNKNRPGPRQILIIEDDEEESKKIAKIFTDEGCLVEIAKNGYEGTSKLISEIPDFVLIKLGLPDIAGDLLILDLEKNLKISDVNHFLYTHRNHEHSPAVLKRISEKSGVDSLIEYLEPQDLLESVNKALKKIDDDF